MRCLELAYSTVDDLSPRSDDAVNEDDTENEDSARVHNQAADVDNVVQAHTINGGVHFHNTPGPRRHDDVPLVVSIRRIRHGNVVVDRDPPQLVPAAEDIEILVEARSVQAVVLHALRPVVLARRQPGPAYYEMTVTGHLEVRPFIVDLDPDSLRLATEGVDFPFTVSASDPELFRLSPTVTEHEVSWQLELDWTCAGRHGLIIINDNGRPFELHPPDHPDTTDMTWAFMEPEKAELYRRYRSLKESALQDGTGDSAAG